MPLEFKSEEQLVSEIVAAYAAKIPELESPALVAGDPLLAIAEAKATQVNWIQSLIKALLIFSRASTAKGVDLDTWMAQFGFLRLPPKKAMGQVRLSVRSAKTFNSIIPIGKVVQTLGGAIQYQLVRDPVQSNWSEEQGAYVIPAGQSNIIATVEAVEAGYASNVQPGLLAYAATSGNNFDDVVNLQAISNGVDAESDEDFRSRFVLYINSLSKNTSPAIQAAIMGVQQGINFNLVENKDINGNDRDGYFTIVVDDGSGYAPQELLDRITDAVEGVRGWTIQFSVIRAQKVLVSASLNIKVKPLVSALPVQAKVQQALVTYINSLKIGDTLYVYNLAAVAKDADPSVEAIQVNSVMINGVELDLTSEIFEVIRTEPSNVAVGAV